MYKNKIVSMYASKAKLRYKRPMKGTKDRTKQVLDLPFGNLFRLNQN